MKSILEICILMIYGVYETFCSHNPNIYTLLFQRGYTTLYCPCFWLHNTVHMIFLVTGNHSRLHYTVLSIFQVTDHQSRLHTLEGGSASPVTSRTSTPTKQPHSVNLERWQLNWKYICSHCSGFYYCVL